MDLWNAPFIKYIMVRNKQSYQTLIHNFNNTDTELIYQIEFPDGRVSDVFKAERD